MEKKLLLLSLLRDHEMHGYQLSEVLGEHVGIPIRLTKSNAYKLLKKLEQDGWISYREEQEGNRPPRRVYQITPAGEAAFQQMLRESIADYADPEFPSAVAFNYLALLPPEEARRLLEQRREKVVAHLESVAGIPDEVRAAHLSVAYLQRFYQAEIEWLDELIAQLRKT